LSSAFEQAKGKVKEGVGDLTDNEELQAEGRAQDEKGAAGVQADEHRAAAQAHEKKADLLAEEADAQ
jgi:uncharacterized protein YjbJ (UPF0337 family)